VLFRSDSISFLLKNYSKVEKGDRISLFVNSNLKIVDGSLSILLLIVEKYTNVEVGFKVLWVSF
jgi:hypothetical protein